VQFGEPHLAGIGRRHGGCIILAPIPFPCAVAASGIAGRWFCEHSRRA
jgi:hypothetical protein